MIALGKIRHAHVIDGEWPNYVTQSKSESNSALTRSYIWLILRQPDCYLELHRNECAYIASVHSCGRRSNAQTWPTRTGSCLSCVSIVMRIKFRLTTFMFTFKKLGPVIITDSSRLARSKTHEDSQWSCSSRIEPNVSYRGIVWIVSRICHNREIVPAYSLADRIQDPFLRVPSKKITLRS